VVRRLSFGRDRAEFDTQFTRTDRQTGHIAAADPAPSFSMLEPERLRAEWLYEAYRVVTLPHSVAEENRGPVSEPPPPPQPAKRRSRWPLRRLRSVLYVARTPNYRSVVLGAVEYTLRRVAGRAGAILRRAPEGS